MLVIFLALIYDKENNFLEHNQSENIEQTASNLQNHRVGEAPPYKGKSRHFFPLFLLGLKVIDMLTGQPFFLSSLQIMGIVQ